MAGVALSRRGFMRAFAFTAAAGLVSGRRGNTAEERLETTAVRLVQDPSSCLAPQYVAEDLLRTEGFTDISFVEVLSDAQDQETIARGKADFALDFALKYVTAIDAGEPLTVLGGVHIGCFDLFASDAIRNIRDLRGKSIGVGVIGGSAQAFLASLGAAIGFDAVRDIRWVTNSTPPPLELFVAGKIEAFLAHPPEVQQVRKLGVGHVLVSSTTDRPWSQYYCCMLAGNNDFIRKNPVATKRVLRAILAAAEICGSDPARAARRVVERRLGDDYETALQTMREIPYGKWRDYDAEDTMRFYALRLHEAGMIKSTPNKIISKGTDWRFLNEVRRELKL